MKIDRFKKYPKSGEYILMKIDSVDKKYINFVNSTIGKVVRYRHTQFGKLKIIVKYENIPTDIVDWFEYWDKGEMIPNLREFDISEVVLYSNDIDELKKELTTRNFNL